MAQRVIQNVENDYLMCSICLGRYDDPRLLPCGHTFCRECLSSHIQQTVIDRNSRHFACPIDRNRVSRPANRAPKEWANLFPKDSFLSSLLQTVIQHESGGNSQDNNRPVHKQNNSRLSGNDRPVRLTHSPVAGQYGAAAMQGSITEGLTCLDHPGRELEFFCLGCNTLVCAYCAVRNHCRQRCECIAIEEAVARLRPRMEALRRRLRGQMSRIEQMSRGETPVDGMLDDSRTRAMAKLDEIEANLSRFTQACLESVEELRQQTREAGRGLMRENAQLARLFDSIQETKLTFRNIVNSNSRSDLLNWLSRMEKQADDYDAAIAASSQTNTPSEAEFIPHTVFNNFLRNPPPIGSIRIKPESGGHTQTRQGCRIQ